MSTPDAPSGPVIDDVVEPTPNPMLAALLGALGGQTAIDPLALMRTQLEGQAANPQMAQLLQLFEQRRAQSQVIEEVVEADDPSTVEDPPVAESLDGIGDVGDRLYAELETLRERSADLAAALGACRLCFGDDALCRLCGGRGEAGSHAPRPEAFRRYVIPAVRRAREVERTPRANDADRPTPRFTARTARPLEPQFDQTTIERQVAS